MNGARALATHIIGGGTPYDDVGQYMIGLSEELNKLRMFKGYVTRSPMVSEAMGAVTDKVFERIEGYEHRAPKKRISSSSASANNKKYNTNDSDIKPSKVCYINVEKIEEDN